MTSSSSSSESLLHGHTMTVWTLSVGLIVGLWVYSKGNRLLRSPRLERKPLATPPASQISGAGRHGRSDSAEAAQTRTAILGGKAAEDATADDIKALTKADFIELFKTLPAASLEELNGEFHGEILPMGMTFIPAYYLMHWCFGPGWWQGKAFSKKEKQGYNLFFTKEGRVSRRRAFDIYSAESAYDDKPSLHLVYAGHNDGVVGRLHDELRCLNDDVFLGLGSSTKGKRLPTNSTPFLISGPGKPLQTCETSP